MFNAGYDMARSYYVATARAFAPVPELSEEIDADVCVVGGGATGLSAALHVREAGLSVVLLEAGRIGWGASGRNGGQMIPGLRKGATELVKSLGATRAKELFNLALDARTLMHKLIEKHAIACDAVWNGHLTLAAKARDLDWMRDEADTLASVMDYPQARVLDKDEAYDKVRAPGMHGGLLDKGGGHVHPLNFTLGLAEAARKAGVLLFENSQAISAVDGEVRTARARVKAKHIVLACDALLEPSLSPMLAKRIMPVANYIVATKPLDRPLELIADGLAVSDSRFVVNYFRMSADRRLIFGGGERYSAKPPADIKGFVRPYVERMFPQLDGVEFAYGWGGLVSISMSRLPHMGRSGNLFYAHGYSGMGVLMSVLGGKLIAEAIAGAPERLEKFAALAPPEFPGGATFRAPLYVLGMLWYALRDRL